MFLKTERDGEMMVDHRASPGAPASYAQGLGYRQNIFGEGKIVHVPTSGCVHCATPQQIRADEMHNRHWCSVCDAYICAYCDRARQQPGYEHLTMKEVVDKVKASNGKLVPMGSAHAPRLVHIDTLGVTEPPPTVSIQTDDHGIKRFKP